MPSPQRLSKALISHPSPSKPGGYRARSLRAGAARSQQVSAGEAELSGAPPSPPCGTRCAGAPTAAYLAPCLRMAAGSAPPFSCRQDDAPHRLGGGSEYLRSSPPTPPLQRRAGRKRGLTALVSLPPSLHFSPGAGVPPALQAALTVPLRAGRPACCREGCAARRWSCPPSWARAWSCRAARTSAEPRRGPAERGRGGEGGRRRFLSPQPGQSSQHLPEKAAT